MKKFKKIFTILVIGMLMFIPALMMYMRYDDFQTQAFHQQKTENWSVVKEHHLDTITNAVYVLYYEAMQQEGISEPADLFYNDLNEEYYETEEMRVEGRKQVNRYIYDWQKDFDKIRDKLDYGIFDRDGNYLAGNTSEEVIVPYMHQISDKQYAYSFLVQYNDKGTLSIRKTTGAEGDRDLEYINDYLEDPLDFGEWLDTNGPENISIVIAIPEDSSLLSNRSSTGVEEEYYKRTDISDWELTLAVFVILIPLILVFFRKMEFPGLYRRNISFEVVWVFVGLVVLPYEWPARLVAATMEGTLMSAIGYYMPSYYFAEAVIAVFNICVWAVLFGLVFLGAAFWSEICVIGPVNYFRKKSLIWRGCASVKRWCGRKLMDIRVMRLEDPKLQKKVRRLLILNAVIIMLFCCMWVIGLPGVIIYVMILSWQVMKYLKSLEVQYGALLDMMNRMADGELDVRPSGLEGPFSTYEKKLSKIQRGFKKAVEKEVASQKMKTELITNVSHDLKTPLTAIITYVNLLKDDNVAEEDRKHYIDTLDKKSMRLKVLIEDLFEVSKAESKNIAMNYVEMNLANLVKQVYVEHEDKLAEAGLDVRMTLPEEIMLDLDSQRTYRIFENLMNNCIKYAMRGTRIYITSVSKIGAVQIIFRNISAEELGDIDPDQLTERFIRGDLARNTEGSGLGLAIARNFAELQGGSLQIDIDGDMFKATVTFTKEKRI